MTSRSYESQNGYSMIEILVVISVVIVIAAIAVLALGSSPQKIDRQNIAKEFKVALERARYDSVRRRASVCSDMARIEITSATAFNIVTDVNQNGLLSGDETRTVNFGSRSRVRIVDDPLPVFPIIIRFDRRGHTSSGACGAETAVEATTVFCESPCTGLSANATNSSIVFVSP